MKIRSITLFVEPSLEPERARRFFDKARKSFPEEVQALRLATTPYPTWWNRSHYPALQAREHADLWTAAGAEFVSLGPVLLRHDAGWLELAPEIIAAGQGLCLAAEIADASGAIDVGRCRAVAGVIRRLSTLAGDGSANFYFAALANCGPGAPLFPAAYHQGGSSRFAAAFVADVIGRSDFQRCGFSGLMFPVLEDEVLAERAAAGLVTVNALLAYAAVCGVGLDTIPLPGDISQDTLCVILLDVAALAVRLDKPLTARLLPMPGLAAGDAVAIELPQVIHGSLMAVQESEGASLRQMTRLQMRPYHGREE